MPRLRWLPSPTPRVTVPALTGFRDVRRILLRSIRIITLLSILAGVLAVSSHARGSMPTTRASSFQPELPIAAAFIYPWYPSHWSGWTPAGEIFPLTNYTPSLGFYSSTDGEITRQQLSLAEQAHLDAFISSWWGPGDETDLALNHKLAVTESTGSPIRWAAYYELEGQGDPPATEIAADLQYFASGAFESPAYLRVDDRPVLFVYGAGGGDCAMVERWVEARQLSGVDTYISLKVFEGYAECGPQPDSWHEYDPSKPAYWYGPHSASLSPGFWAYGHEETLPRDPELFDALVEWMAASGVDWQLITTWNEWIEGTTIEPTQEYGQIYVDILCAHLPGSVPCGSTTPSPTPPPIPPPTPTPSEPLAPTPTATPSIPPSLPTPEPISVLLGDVDCDADVDTLDVLNILTGVGFGSFELPLTCGEAVTAIDVQISGDVDCDLDVDSVDALKILRFLISVPYSQEEPCVAIGEPVSPF